jgi:DNA-binding CsgD family transcriptional regulator
VYGDREYFIFTDKQAWAEGLLACRQGRSEGRAMLRGTADRLLEKGAPGIAGMLLADLHEWEAGSGDFEASAETMERLRAIADQIRRPLYSGLAAIARAQGRHLAGDTRDATASAFEAVNLLSSTGCRAYLGRAYEVLGLSLSGTDRPAAVDAFEQAAVIFENCGAVWRRERCLEALRGLRGRGGRAAAAVSGPTSLSKREREVARLAGKGMTAGEIAAELFISERTVEGHLANVYAKLGVSSKLELVRRADELAL